MSEQFCYACTLMRAALNTKHKCCLNCRFSYFRYLEEGWMCWNQEHVKGIQPKLVEEFWVCPLWQGK